MKLKCLIGAFLCVFLSGQALGADAGFRYIKTHGKVRCGTDLSSKTYAYKDEDGIWRGIDAAWCRIFAEAVLGNPELFEMIQIENKDVSKALTTNKIDIMLGNTQFTAGMEISGKAAPFDILYYDRLMLLAKAKNGATSMEDYAGLTVCAVKDSEDYQRILDYSRRYKLDFKYLMFNTNDRAKQAFLLDRCQLFPGNEIYLKGIIQNNYAKDAKVEILPEVIGIKPIYAYVHRDNNTLRISGKWILNALTLAEEENINSKNVNIFIGIEDNSTRNLLGIDETLWRKFGLTPDWVKKVLNSQGNYGEIFEKNLGGSSPLNLPRDKNNLLKNGGLIRSQPFL